MLRPVHRVLDPAMVSASRLRAECSSSTFGISTRHATGGSTDTRQMPALKSLVLPIFIIAKTKIHLDQIRFVVCCTLTTGSWHNSILIDTVIKQG
jgi:hypothetical protein